LLNPYINLTESFFGITGMIAGQSLQVLSVGLVIIIYIILYIYSL